MSLKSKITAEHLWTSNLFGVRSESFLDDPAVEEWENEHDDKLAVVLRDLGEEEKNWGAGQRFLRYLVRFASCRKGKLQKSGKCLFVRVPGDALAPEHRNPTGPKLVTSTWLTSALDKDQTEVPVDKKVWVLPNIDKRGLVTLRVDIESFSYAIQQNSSGNFGFTSVTPFTQFGNVFDEKEYRVALAPYVLRELHSMKELWDQGVQRSHKEKLFGKVDAEYLYGKVDAKRPLGKDDRRIKEDFPAFLLSKGFFVIKRVLPVMKGSPALKERLSGQD